MTKFSTLHWDGNKDLNRLVDEANDAVRSHRAMIGDDLVDAARDAQQTWINTMDAETHEDTSPRRGQLSIRAMDDAQAAFEAALNAIIAIADHAAED